MKILLLVVAFLLLLPASIISAHEEMSLIAPTEVFINKSPDKCWVIFDENVYDVTDYLASHEEKFIPIEEWCGTDITQAFQDKDGRDRDHKEGAYELLEKYYIGMLDRDKTTYTASDVAEHNSVESCWVTFDGGVYDITSSLDFHGEKFLEIEPWCGTDMTEAFKDKDGRDRDHKEGTYESLATIQIGVLTEEIAEPNSTYEFRDPYNFYAIFIGTILLYTITWGLTKWKRNDTPILQIRNHRLIWNTVLVITLIPALLFGIIMSMKFSVPFLAELDFNWLFWHVEGSIIFGTAALMHLLERLDAYLMPAKLLFKKKTNDKV